MYGQTLLLIIHSFINEVLYYYIIINMNQSNISNHICSKFKKIFTTESKFCPNSFPCYCGHYEIEYYLCLECNEKSNETSKYFESNPNISYKH